MIESYRYRTSAENPSAFLRKSLQRHFPYTAAVFFVARRSKNSVCHRCYRGMFRLNRNPFRHLPEFYPNLVGNPGYIRYSLVELQRKFIYFFVSIRILFRKSPWLYKGKNEFDGISIEFH